MDSRLDLLTAGKRLGQQRLPDLPALASAIVAQLHGEPMSVLVFSESDPPIVRLLSNTFEVVVLASDWRKIMPFLKDGSFNPYLYPIATTPQSENNTPTSPDGVDPLYTRVLGVLQMLFPDTYPTSNL